MAEFTRRPLAILDNLYRFVGGLKGVNRLDLSSDITLVHDVSRQGEKRGSGGYFGRARWQNTVSVSGETEERLFREDDIAPALGFDTEEYEVWITDVSGYVSSADLADMTSVTFHIGSNTVTRLAEHFGTGELINFPYAYFLQADFRSSANSAGTTVFSVGYHPPQPIRVPPHAWMGVQIVTTASANFNFTVELWIGPFGSSPPGVS